MNNDNVTCIYYVLFSLFMFMHTRMNQSISQSIKVCLFTTNEATEYKVNIIKLVKLIKYSL